MLSRRWFQEARSMADRRGPFARQDAFFSCGTDEKATLSFFRWHLIPELYHESRERRIVNEVGRVFNLAVVAYATYV